MAAPISWGAGRETLFRTYIYDDLQRALDGRRTLENQWVTWLSMYLAPRGPARGIPMEGASNETLPCIATDCDQLYAKFMQTLHAAPNLWSVSPLNERWIKVAKPLQDFLQLVDQGVLKMHEVNERAILEMCKLGTAIYKVGWTFERRKTKNYNPDGSISDVEITKSLPFVDHVRLHDFVMPQESFAIDPDAQGGAPWVGERIRVSPDRLRMLAKATAPALPNIAESMVEKILRFEEAQLTVADAARVKNDYSRRAFHNEPVIEVPTTHEVLAAATGAARVRQIELWEIHARFPTKNEREYEDIVVLWHQGCREVVRATLNPYAHAARPYEVVRYFPGEGFYGIGICQQKEMFQRMLSDLYNFGVDGAILSNSIMLGAKGGANILPGEPFYPTKVWVTEGNPRDELFPIQMGQLNPSLTEFIQMTQLYGERRTSVSDLSLGNMESMPGRTPATTTVSMLQEANRRPDLTIKSMRVGLGRIGLRLVQLFQQYLTSPMDVGQERVLRIMVESLGMPEGQLLAEKLALPLENAELGVGVSLSATSGSSNKEVDKQNSLALMQQAAQVGPLVLQMVQVAEQNPGTMTGQTAQLIANALTELYRRNLEQNDVRDPESIVPAFTPAPPAALGALPGPGGSGLGAPGQPGMEALPGGPGVPGGMAGAPAPVGAPGA